MTSGGTLRPLGLVALYLATRLTGLGLLPVFLDERLHLRWALWVAEGERLRLPFISGRGLNVYLLAGVVPHVDDLVLAGRLLTVAVGALALLACHELARSLFGPRAALLAALLYVACPFTLFHDRMVLNDAFLTAFVALLLLASVRLARSPGWGPGLLAGGALGLAVLSKTTGLLFAAVPPLAVALLASPGDRRRALGPLGAGYALAAAAAAYPLWLFFDRSAELQGAIGVREDEAGRAANVLSNLQDAAGWLWRYWTPLVVLLAAAALLLAVRGRARRETALLALSALVPVAALVAVAQIWYPRYLLPATVPALVLAASAADAGLTWAAAWKGRAGQAAAAIALVVASAPALRFDWMLWTDPSRAPLPYLDRFQYVVGWPSGYGVRDTVAFVKAELDRRRAVTVAVAGTSPSGSALRLLLRDDPRLRIVPAGEAVPPALEPAVDTTTYLLVSPIQGGRLPQGWEPRVRAVFTSFKPDGTVADRMYQVCPAGGRCGP